MPGRKKRPISVAPKRAHIFRPLEVLKPGDVRAIILGQDPYSNPSSATGRAFEQGNLNEWPTSRGAIADSLRRIVQVLANARTGTATYVDGERGWEVLVRDVHEGRLALESPRELFDHLQSEGVLLLNTSLTVSVDVSAERPKRIHGHFRLWQPVLYRFLSSLAARQKRHLVFLLWGGRHAFDIIERGGIPAAAERAGTWQSRVDIVRHMHPAAITREGAVFLHPPNPFLTANKALERMGARPIAW